MLKEIGIYIHIPFCQSKCYYCNFTSYCNMEDKIEKYIDAICNEIIKNAEILSEYRIKTIYFGGGTPSYIESKYIEKILNTIRLFNKFEDEFEEITIEVNPNSASLEKLKKYRECGINRLSIGLQSTDNEVLKYIGRIHTYEDFITCLNNAKEAGYTNISIDLMYPLPKMNIDILNDSINKIKELKDNYNIKHISIYNLEVHENTKLAFLLKNGFLDLIDEEQEYLMKETIDKKLTEFGYNKYEISNYAIKGYESMHNTNYWNQGYYIGIGAGASSFILGSRFKNTDNIDEYINGINNFKDTTIEKEDMDKLELMKEYVILKLRLMEGINIKAFNKKFETNIYDIFKIELNSLIKKGLLKDNGNNISLTKRGTEVANIVWEEFI